VVGVARDAGVHLVLIEATAEAVLAVEHGAGFEVESGFALVDLPGGEEGGVPQLSFVDGVGCAGLNLMLPEAEAGVLGGRGVEVADRSVEAVVEEVVELAFFPAKDDGSEEDVGYAGGLGGDVEEVGVEAGVDDWDDDFEPVLCAENFVFGGDHEDVVVGDDVDVGLEESVAFGALERIDAIDVWKIADEEAGG